ncbi:MAG: hypothetical protein AAFO07_01475 [Bacteroidota bacterium]
MLGFIKNVLGIRSDFDRIFFENEYKALAGNNNKTILGLILILFFTLLALGFAIGSLNNLKIRMDNPYTNWVNVSLGNQYPEEQKEAIRDTFDVEKKLAKSLNLIHLNGWNKYFISLYAQSFNPLRDDPNETQYYIARTIDPEEPLITTILNQEEGSRNLLWHHPDFDPTLPAEQNYCNGVIVSLDLLKKLGYVKESMDCNLIWEESLMWEPPVTQLLVKDSDEASNQKANMFLADILAVVCELPSSIDLVTRPKMYNILTLKLDQTNGMSFNCYEEIFERHFEYMESNRFSFYVQKEQDFATFEKVTKDFFSTIPFRANPQLQAIPNSDLYQKATIYFPAGYMPTYDSIGVFVNHCRSNGLPIAEFSRINCDFPECEELGLTAYNYMAFNFSKLNKIQAFRYELQEKQDVSIEYEKIEAAENFALVSNLTLIICIILLAFGLLSIILFVNNLLRNHLFDVRSNLGTFQAFGLSNVFLNQTYLKIIVAFLLLSILTSFSLVVIIDRIEQYIMGPESKFNIFSIYVGVAILGLILISIIISIGTIRKILGDTPGNLIYKR